MSELFEKVENKVLVAEEDADDGLEVADADKVTNILQNSRSRPGVDARRRLEQLLEEKRLRDELNDFVDY